VTGRLQVTPSLRKLEKLKIIRLMEKHKKMNKLDNSASRIISDGVTKSGPVTSHDQRTDRDGATPSHPVTGKMKKIIFGTDGWRGLIGDELNQGNIAQVAQAFALFLKEKQQHNRVAIGYDGRKYSDTFAMVFARVLKANGIDVLLSDRVIPTPVVSFTCIHQNCQAGVMITASHNPPQYNGIKFKSAQGSPFATEDTAWVETLIGMADVTMTDSNLPTVNLLNPYLTTIEKQFDFNAIRKAGIKPAIDSMAGAGGLILKELLQRHGITSQTIFGTPDPDFSGRLAEPVERNLQPLSNLLKSGSFAVGLATDGDADRLGVMTNSGQWMNVQETILYLAQYVKSTRGITGPLVKTASVTDRMLQLFPGEPVADVQVGFKYVAEAMMETQAAFGAEESGGFGFKEHLPERDGIFSALMFLEMIARSGFPTLDGFMAQKRQELGEICYDRIDAENHSETRHEVLPGLVENVPESVASYPVEGIQTYKSSRGIINGLKIRMEGHPRWVLLRVSETEPIVRIYAEAETNEEVQKLLEAGKRFFE
jgi:phosphomannomutase